MNDELALIDSNVLIYAYDVVSEKHAAAKAVLDRAFSGGTGAVSVQNLAEFSCV